MNEARYMFQIEGLASDNTLFTAIQSAGSCFPDVTTAELQLLAEEYYAHSSKKRLSPICRKWVDDSADLTAFITKVASALVTRFGANWKRVFETYFKTDYNPINNYDMEEVETPYLIDQTEISTKTKLVNTQENETYGFNSTDPVGESKTTITTEGDPTENVTNSKSSKTGNKKLTRSGNIGVTTSAQLVEGELELRKLDYWGKVFADIDRFLCYVVTSC